MGPLPSQVPLPRRRNMCMLLLPLPAVSMAGALGELAETNNGEGLAPAPARAGHRAHAVGVPGCDSSSAGSCAAAAAWVATPPGCTPPPGVWESAAVACAFRPRYGQRVMPCLRQSFCRWVQGRGIPRAMRQPRSSRLKPRRPVRLCPDLLLHAWPADTTPCCTGCGERSGTADLEDRG